MNVIDAVAFFNASHAIVAHTDSEALRVYALWIDERYIEAPTYLELAVKAKARYDDLVMRGVIEGTVVMRRPPYEGAEGMKVTWPKDTAL